MKIWTKNILLNRNIDKVKYDFRKLTGNSGLDDVKNKFELFYGEINEEHFKYYCIPTRLDTPVLEGEFFCESESKTIMKIRIHASFWKTILFGSFFIFSIYFTITELPRILSEMNIFWRIFSTLVIFMAPMMNFGYYFYNLKSMIDDFYLYNQGFYDKYLK